MPSFWLEPIGQNFGESIQIRLLLGFGLHVSDQDLSACQFLLTQDHDVAASEFVGSTHLGFQAFLPIADVDGKSFEAELLSELESVHAWIRPGKSDENARCLQDL